MLIYATGYARFLGLAGGLVIGLAGGVVVGSIVMVLILRTTRRRFEKSNEEPIQISKISKEKQIEL